jgi:positive regulator of sigma E activity
MISMMPALLVEVLQMNQLIAMTLATTIVGLPIVLFAWWLVRHHDKEKAKSKEKNKQDTMGQ